MTASSTNKPSLPAFPSDSALAAGWNTWNTHSVLSHVLMPSALALNLGFCHYGMLATVRNAVFGTKNTGATAGVRLAADDIKARKIRILPGLHALDGGYTSLTVELGDFTIQVETARLAGEELVILVSPVATSEWRPPSLLVEAGILWNRPGHVIAEGRDFRACLPGSDLIVRHTGQAEKAADLGLHSPSWAIPLSGPVGISAGCERTLEEITEYIAQARNSRTRPEAESLRSAYVSCLAWNTFYDPLHQRVLTTPSRAWNIARLGYGVFCWDSFFAAWLLAAEDIDLARNMALEAFREMVDGEFVPNVTNGSGRLSADRSQPPIGSLAVLALHEIAPEEDFLKQTFPSLLAWNRWWHRARQNQKGLLSWGSNPITPKNGDLAELIQPNTRLGAALESGMDNAPFYDDAAFDAGSGLMELSDVGLVSLYLTDCQALAKLARILTLRRNSRAGSAIIAAGWRRSGVPRRVFFSIAGRIRMSSIPGWRRPCSIPCWQARRRPGR